MLLAVLLCRLVQKAVTYSGALEVDADSTAIGGGKKGIALASSLSGKNQPRVVDRVLGSEGEV
jgi:hypothetical protein